MALFTKTNNTILHDGRVDWEDNQDIDGNKFRYAGKEVNDNDYVIRKTLTTHNHDSLYADILHSHGSTYAPIGHDDGIPVSNHSPGVNGYTELPDGLFLQWGATPLQTFQGRLGHSTAGTYWYTSGWISFPTPFPNNVFSVKLTGHHDPNTTWAGMDFTEMSVSIYKLQNNRFQYQFFRTSGNNDGSGPGLPDPNDSFHFNYIAWGY